MNAKQLRDYIVVPTLMEIGMLSTPAVRLVLGTCAQESAMGEYIHQKGDGPALGIFQMEPNTHADIWANFILRRPDLAGRLWSYLPDRSKCPDPRHLMWNLPYAVALCRVHYYRVNDPIPNNLVDQAAYYKRHYNTPKGAATESDYIQNYQRYVGDL